MDETERAHRQDGRADPAGRRRRCRRSTGSARGSTAPPLTREQLKGKVVVIDFWTYSCINCLRSLPYVKAWDEQVSQGRAGGDRRPRARIRVRARARQCRQGGQGPRHPLSGRARQRLRAVARAQEQLLAGALFRRCARAHPLPPFRRGRLRDVGAGDPPAARRSRPRAAGRGDGRRRSAAGAEAAAALGDIQSPETYIGYARAERFVSPGGLLHDQPKTYAAAPLALNDWSLEGQWLDGGRARGRWRPARRSASASTPATCTSCSARPSGKPVRFRVTLDGQAPGGDAGIDVAARRQRRGHGAAALPAGPAEGRGPRPHLHHRVPRSGRRGLLLHFRLRWRSGRDSNPRYGFAVYSLSRRAPSTTRPPLRIRWKGGPSKGRARAAGKVAGACRPPLVPCA